MTLPVALPPRTSSFFRRLVIGVVLFMLTGVLIWWGVWAVAMSHYETTIDNLITSLRQEGYQVDYADRRRFGFPERVTLRFRDLSWKSADGIIFRTSGIDISSSLRHWDAFDAHFKDGATLEAPLEQDGTALHLSAAQGRATVTLDDNSRWLKARLVLQASHLGRSPNNLFGMSTLTLDAERPAEAPKTKKEPGLTLAGRAEEVELSPGMPTVFGTKMDKFAVTMRVMGNVPDVRRRSAVEVWNRDVGVVEFSRFDMDWGTLHLRARGTMGFDDDLQPEGAFVGGVSEPEPVLKALMDGGFIAQRQAGMLSSALSLFAKPAEGDDKKSEDDHSVELPVAVQLGGLFLGPVRVFAFPPIEWQN